MQKRPKTPSELAEALPWKGSAKIMLRFSGVKKHTSNISMAMCDKQMP